MVIQNYCQTCKRNDHLGECERCTQCGKLVQIMIYRGSGLCSGYCRKELDNE
jgi:hypothetical protein